jgi:flagellar L-ring protein precursor FlgH
MTTPKTILMTACLLTAPVAAEDLPMPVMPEFLPPAAMPDMTLAAPVEFPLVAWPLQTASLITRHHQAALSTAVSPDPDNPTPGSLEAMSMFYVAKAKPRTFHVHDLLQVVINETSRARSSHELETEKEWGLSGEVSDFPYISWGANFLENNGSTVRFPSYGFSGGKDFQGEGDYSRRDDLTARISVEVIEILPNGNLVLEGRSRIKTDDEEQAMMLTGICRPKDVSPANTILSNLIHDLHIEKMHEGELAKAAEKGIIARALDALFAF